MSTIDQLSVFLENRAGRLAEVTHCLAENGVNIRALSLADTSDFGILRLLVSDVDLAKSVLKQHGFTLGTNLVVAVELPDQPGGLDDVMQLLSSNGVNVEYMYHYVPRGRCSTDKAIIIFRFDKVDLAVDLLEAHGKSIISQDQFCTR